MRGKRIFLVLLLFIFWATTDAQCPISSLGQNPSTAFPVCGTNTFEQKQVNLCGGKLVAHPSCRDDLTDINPYWYKFTCFESGTLGLTINPKSDTSDYDWQLFDITDHDPGEVYTNPKLVIASNWSQEFGATGTQATARSVMECGGPTPKYSKLPTVIKGRQYLLLVSHFTNNQAGYNLEFSGGTASITDTAKPKMKELGVACSGRTMGIKLNKRMKCSSVAANGSDFAIFPTLSAIIKSVAPECKNGFDFDSLTITFDRAVPIGKYTLKAKTGTDGNTLLDNCDQPLRAGDSLQVVLGPPSPTPMDFVKAVKCKPTRFELVFSTKMRCESVAANGSDFVISGPSVVTIKSAHGDTCEEGLSNSVFIELAEPVQTAGIYSITLKRGNDGNTLLNECDKETPAGDMVLVNGYDTASASIDYAIALGCTADTLMLSNKGLLGVTSWRWTIDDLTRTTQYVQRAYSSGKHDIVLMVSNGVCADTSSVTINFDRPRLNADFTAPLYACRQDTAFFVNASTGPIATWQWDFGNGNQSNQKEAPYQFYVSNGGVQQTYVTLTITDGALCTDTAVRIIQVPEICYIGVPSAFTPNADGLNDYLYPLNAWKAQNLDFRVFDRYGQLVWKTSDWTKKWDGKRGGVDQAAGTYVWYLRYFDPDKNKIVEQKGTTTLIR